MPNPGSAREVELDEPQWIWGIGVVEGEKAQPYPSFAAHPAHSPSSPQGNYDLEKSQHWVTLPQCPSFMAPISFSRSECHLEQLSVFDYCVPKYRRKKRPSSSPLILPLKLSSLQEWLPQQTVDLIWINHSAGVGSTTNVCAPVDPLRTADWWGCSLLP